MAALAPAIDPAWIAQRHDDVDVGAADAGWPLERLREVRHGRLKRRVFAEWNPAAERSTLRGVAGRWPGASRGAVSLRIP